MLNSLVPAAPNSLQGPTASCDNIWQATLGSLLGKAPSVLNSLLAPAPNSLERSTASMMLKLCGADVTPAALYSPLYSPLEERQNETREAHDGTPTRPIDRSFPHFVGPERGSAGWVDERPCGRGSAGIGKGLSKGTTEDAKSDSDSDEDEEMAILSLFYRAATGDPFLQMSSDEQFALIQQRMRDQQGRALGYP